MRTKTTFVDGIPQQARIILTPEGAVITIAYREEETDVAGLLISRSSEREEMLDTFTAAELRYIAKAVKRAIARWKEKNFG